MICVSSLESRVPGLLQKQAAGCPHQPSFLPDSCPPPHRTQEGRATPCSLSSCFRRFFRVPELLIHPVLCFPGSPSVKGRVQFPGTSSTQRGSNPLWVKRRFSKQMLSRARRRSTTTRPVLKGFFIPLLVTLSLGSLDEPSVICYCFLSDCRMHLSPSLALLRCSGTPKTPSSSSLRPLQSGPCFPGLLYSRGPRTFLTSFLGRPFCSVNTLSCPRPNLPALEGLGGPAPSWVGFHTSCLPALSFSVHPPVALL